MLLTKIPPLATARPFFHSLRLELAFVLICGVFLPSAIMVEFPAITQHHHVSSLGEIDDKLQDDFYYIKNLSYWLDILIVGRTVRVALSGFGAK